MICFILFSFIQFENKKSNTPYNVIIIVFDSLRADHLGSYGYNRRTSPHIDELSSKGILFKNAFTQSSSTSLSVMSLFTGNYPSVHGVYGFKNYKLRESQRSLIEYINKNNYVTTAFIANPVLHKNRGFSRGFDTYELNCSYLDNSPYKTDSECLNHRFSEYISKTNKPFFLYLHYLDPHYPYMPPNEFRRWSYDYEYDNHTVLYQLLDKINNGENLTSSEINSLISLYDGEIRYIDKNIEFILEELSNQGLSENTILIVTSDHGEEFLEHNYLFHGWTLYDEVIHVPLIFYGSPFNQSVIDSPVRSIDILSTILDYLDIKTNSVFNGVSLRPMIEKNELQNLTVLSESFKGRIRENNKFSWGIIKSIRRKDHKYIYNVKITPYNLNRSEVNLKIDSFSEKADQINRNLFSQEEIKIKEELYELPGTESENLKIEKPTILSIYRKDFQIMFSSIDVEDTTTNSIIKLDKKTKERLKSLGYL